MKEERVGKNEALFREVNERIRDISGELGQGELADFLCECGERDCTHPISLTLPEYETVRAAPDHFAIAPGHELSDVEQVVAGNPRFLVVEKKGVAAVIALETDPRSTH